MIRVGEEEIAWRPGLTVSGLLAELGDKHDYAVARIVSAEKNISVARPDFDYAPIPDDAVVYLIHILAGG